MKISAASIINFNAKKKIPKVIKQDSQTKIYAQTPAIKTIQEDELGFLPQYREYIKSTPAESIVIDNEQALTEDGKPFTGVVISQDRKGNPIKKTYKNGFIAEIEGPKNKLEKYEEIEGIPRKRGVIIKSYDNRKHSFPLTHTNIVVKNENNEVTRKRNLNYLTHNGRLYDYSKSADNELYCSGIGNYIIAQGKDYITLENGVIYDENGKITKRIELNQPTDKYRYSITEFLNDKIEITTFGNISSEDREKLLNGEIALSDIKIEEDGKFKGKKRITVKDNNRSVIKIIEKDNDAKKTAVTYFNKNRAANKKEYDSNNGTTTTTKIADDGTLEVSVRKKGDKNAHTITSIIHPINEITFGETEQITERYLDGEYVGKIIESTERCCDEEDGKKDSLHHNNSPVLKTTVEILDSKNRVVFKEITGSKDKDKVMAHVHRDGSKTVLDGINSAKVTETTCNKNGVVIEKYINNTSKDEFLNTRATIIHDFNQGDSIIRHISDYNPSTKIATPVLKEELYKNGSIKSVEYPEKSYAPHPEFKDEIFYSL